LVQFVAGTQTINALAFVFDGINFGASDYTYSAYSMVNHPFSPLIKPLKVLPNNKFNDNLQVGVAAISIPCLTYLAAHNGFIGIWVALTIYMSLRTIASIWRYDTTTPLSLSHFRLPFLQ
jgi:Na+-driven multidrug efflux pump